MRSGQKGFSAPLILIVVLLLLAVPAYFVLRSSVGDSDIQGASSNGGKNSKQGLSVSITSNSSTWDLVEYVCVDFKACSSSLTEGTRWGSISGGQTDLHEVVIDYSSQWDTYEYLKLFVKSGWNDDEVYFSVKDLGDVPGSEVITVTEGGLKYDMIVVPLSKVSSGFYESAHFSDL